MPEIKTEDLSGPLSKLCITDAKIKVKNASKTAEKVEKSKKDEKAKGKPEKKGLTPYQGDRRSFGWFQCKTPNCKASWSSANSWADTYQKCKQCMAVVYPYRQAKLERGGGRKENRPPHPADLCGMCVKLGRRCF